ncbi:hypothetical protein ABZW11_04880 [Nonomuraea sp. NPDC004580]|uniref:hypothetical protein n=1 Tax=Nonomuraea sp. NPDC004580 TaxID=3154552 RepID=UPI0033B9786C
MNSTTTRRPADTVLIPLDFEAEYCGGDRFYLEVSVSDVEDAAARGVPASSLPGRVVSAMGGRR